jgi:hypothetical protein
VQTNVYIDAFNLYYGCLRKTPYRWLDLAKLCQLTLPSFHVNRIRYFTALIRPRADNPQKAQRQQVYLRALQTIPRLSIHHGHYLSSVSRKLLANPPPNGPRTVEVLNTEEKGSDVNLATLLLCDGFDGDYEMAIVISNDSDLVMPIEIVRRKLGLEVGILNPQKNPSRALRGAATFYRPIRVGALSASQFPLTLHDPQGRITRPPTW